MQWRRRRTASDVFLPVLLLCLLLNSRMSLWEEHDIENDLFLLLPLVSHQAKDSGRLGPVVEKDSILNT